MGDDGLGTADMFVVCSLQGLLHLRVGARLQFHACTVWASGPLDRGASQLFSHKYDASMILFRDNPLHADHTASVAHTVFKLN